MLESIYQSITIFFLNYGAFGILLSSFIEEVIAPIPSTIVILSASFILLYGQKITIISLLKLILIIGIPAALGMTLGSSIIYLAVYKLGKPFIDKYGWFLTLKWEDVIEFNEKLGTKNADDLVLFLSRSTPILPSVVVNSFYGIIRYDFKKFVLLTFTGSLIKAICMGFIGWQFGIIYNELNEKISHFEKIGLIILILSLIIYIMYKRKK